MTVPVDFEASMDSKSTIVRIRRKVQRIGALYCGTVMTVPYGGFRLFLYPLYQTEAVFSRFFPSVARFGATEGGFGAVG